MLKSVEDMASKPHTHTHTHQGRTRAKQDQAQACAEGQNRTWSVGGATTHGRRNIYVYIYVYYYLSAASCFSAAASGHAKSSVRARTPFLTSRCSCTCIVRLCPHPALIVTAHSYLALACQTVLPGEMQSQRSSQSLPRPFPAPCQQLAPVQLSGRAPPCDACAQLLRPDAYAQLPRRLCSTSPFQCLHWPYFQQPGRLACLSSFSPVP